MKKIIFIVFVSCVFANFEMKSQVIERDWTRSPSMLDVSAIDAYKKFFNYTGFSGNYFDENYIKKHKIRCYYVKCLDWDTIQTPLTGEDLLNYSFKKEYNYERLMTFIFDNQGKLKCLKDHFIPCDSIQKVSCYKGVKDGDSGIVWFKYFYAYRDSLILKELPTGKMYINFIPSYIRLWEYVRDRYQFIYVNKAGLPYEFISFGETPWTDRGLRRTYVEYDRKGRVTKVTEVYTEFNIKHKKSLLNTPEPEVNVLKIKYLRNKTLVYLNDTLFYRKIAKKNYILVENSFQKNLITFKTNKRKIPVSSVYYYRAGLYDESSYVVIRDTFFTLPQ